MNKAYRLIWSKAKERWVIVAEIVSGKGGPAGGAVAAVSIGVWLALTATGAHALPTGGQVAAGQATISTPSNSQLNISQGTNQAIINWNSFGIGKGEAVSIAQPSASATLLNRVLGNDPSQIFGSLTANGRVFLVNPGGVLFAPGAQVNVGGLVASSLNIKDGDFLAGNYSFFKDGAAGAVVNQGKLTGGFVALLGSSVANAGTIVTTKGSTGLAAGDAITLGFDPAGLMAIKVETAAYQAQVENSGVIEADGGIVLMTASAADALLATVVNNSGKVRAGSMVERNGEIVLEAASVINSGTLDASGLAGDGGRITLQAAGSLSHTGVIRADAAADSIGKGGTVALIASLANPGSVAQINGSISARGGNLGGDGGFVETSAERVRIGANTSISTAAPHGKSGTWLVDPVDFTIAATGGDLDGATLATNLAGGNISILSGSGAVGTSGDLNVNDVVTWSANTLTLSAQNNININANLNGSGSASLALHYGQKGLAAGNSSDVILHAVVNLPAGPNFSTKLGSDGAVKNFTVITALGGMGSSSAADLQGMTGNLAGNFALGANIDATATVGWNAGAGFTPVGDANTYFTGRFDGLGHTITNLSINLPGVNSVGLFGATENGSVLRNVGLVGGSVTGHLYVGTLVGDNRSTEDNCFSTGSVYGENVGGLAGQNYGSISNSRATGSVNGGFYAGGLVGVNNGTVRDSYATGKVSGGAMLGGLVGVDNGSASRVSNCYATGDVSGLGALGGLVGTNDGTVSGSHATGNLNGMYVIGGLAGSSGGTISQSYATGSVTGTRQSIGGLVGENYGLVSGSHATGSVSGQDNVGGLVGYNSASTISGNYASGTVFGSGDGVGGLVGSNAGGSVADNYASGNVTGWGNYVGGLLGNNTGSVADTYASGNVSGTGTKVGGLVGANQLGTVNNSYSTGSVSGASVLGGLIGFNSGSVADSFWNTDTSGQALSDGGSGLTSTQMTQLASFSSWNSSTPNTIANTGGSGALWRIYEGHTAPLLSYFMTGLTLTDAPDASLTYSGAVQSGASTANGAPLILGAAASGKNVGFYNGYYSTQQGYDITGGNLIITPASISLNGTRAYDGTANAAAGIFTINGLVAGEQLTLSGSGSFTNKIVGNGRPVSLDSLSLGNGGNGGLASNYTFAGGSHTADITPAALTVTATGINKVYDGGVGAAVTLSDNRIAGDALTLSNSSANFLDKNVATGKTVNVAGINLAGTDAGNYTFNTTAVSSADISKAALTVSATGINKVYDGNTSAAVTLSDNRIAGDVLTLSKSGASFLDKNAATGKTINVSGINVAGTDAGNYTFNTTAVGSADISKAALTVSATGINKVYDGSTSAAVTLADNRISDDVLALSNSGASFLDKNAATGKTINVSGINIAGTDAGNYTFNTTAVSSADISKAALTVSATGINKVYDGNTGAAVTLADNRVAGDVLTLSIGGASFLDKNAATGKTINVSGINITGTDAGNYTFNTTAVGSADISKAALTVSATGISKVYDGSTDAAVTLADNRVAGDVLVLSNSGASFLDKNAATGKTVNVSGINVTGLDAANYSFNSVAVTSADIRKAHLTVTADDKSRFYGQDNPTLTTTVSGYLEGENATIAAVSGAGSATTTATAATNVGSAVITAGAGSLAAQNYDFTILKDGTLTINAAQSSATPAPPVPPVPPVSPPISSTAPTAPIIPAASIIPTAPYRAGAPTMAVPPAPVIIPEAPDLVAASGVAPASEGAGQGSAASTTSNPSGFFPVKPLVLNVTSSSFVYRLPNDTFTHSDPGASFGILARMEDGSALPSWLSFDPVGKVLSGTPPGIPGEFRIMLVAADQDGQEAITVLTIIADRKSD